MEDLTIMFTRCKTNAAGKTATIRLGVCAGVYYVQFNDGFWDEIPAYTEKKAIAYYSNLSFIF